MDFNNNRPWWLNAGRLLFEFVDLYYYLKKSNARNSWPYIKEELKIEITRGTVFIYYCVYNSVS